MTKDVFCDQMWLTYKARFNAHSRLLRQEILYTVTIAFLSFFVIVLNILQLMPVILEIRQEATTFYTITISIFILVVSLINNSSARRRNAEQFHACALEIKSLYGEFSAVLEDMTNENYSNFIQRYSAIVRKYDINHQKCDYQQVLVDQGKTISKDKFCFYVKYYIVNYFLCSMLLVLPVVFGLIIIFSS